MIEEYLSTTEVAEFHGVTRSRVLQWIKEGDLPAEKKDWSWLIKREDCENLKRKPIPGRPPKNDN